MPNYGQAATEAVAAAIAGHPRVWFVWEADHYTDPDGVIRAYLNAHCRPLSDEPLPLVGRLILYENAAGSAGS